MALRGDRLLLTVFVISSLSHVATAFATPGPFDNLDERYPSRIQLFKVRVKAGDEYCYYQYVEESVSFGHAGLMSYEAITVVRNSENEIIKTFTPDEKGMFTYRTKKRDIYSLCVNNVEGNVEAFMYLYVHIFKEQLQNDTVEESMLLSSTTRGLRERFANLSLVIEETYMKLSAQPMQEYQDFLVIQSTNARVQTWSVIVCSVQIAVAIFYVYFIRRLFRISDRNQARA